MARWPDGHKWPNMAKMGNMGRKGPRAKTKTVLKSVSQLAQFGTMQNLKFQTFLNKNHPNNTLLFASQD